MRDRDLPPLGLGGGREGRGCDASVPRALHEGILIGWLIIDPTTISGQFKS